MNVVFDIHIPNSNRIWYVFCNQMRVWIRPDALDEDKDTPHFVF